MRFLVAILFCLIVQTSHAQELECGFGRHQFDSTYEQWYQNATHFIQSQSAKRALISTDTVYRIQVVFHIITNNKWKFEKSQLDRVFNQINLDFRRRNSDTIKMRKMFYDRVSDSRIEFVLADSTPDGLLSQGYTYQSNNSIFGTKTSLPYSNWHNMKFDSLGGVKAWDTKKYLNIWVCDLTASDGKKYLGGFSTAPPNSIHWKSQYYGDSLIDGVVLDYYYFVMNSRVSTPTHEIGHYLGLRHVSGDPGAISGNCQFDDFIFDTPKIDAQNYFCDTTINSCIDSANDFPDMIENYMDYSGDLCRNAFTKGQISLMRYTLGSLRKEIYSKIILNEYDPLNKIIQFSPNPFINHLNIQINQDDLHQIHIEIYDHLGQLCLKRMLEMEKTELDVSDFVSGVYYIKVIGNNQEVLRSEKLIKL
jgi:hypothetical protein